MQLGIIECWLEISQSRNWLDYGSVGLDCSIDRLRYKSWTTEKATCHSSLRARFPTVSLMLGRSARVSAEDLVAVGFLTVTTTTTPWFTRHKMDFLPLAPSSFLTRCLLCPSQWLSRWMFPQDPVVDLAGWFQGSVDQCDWLLAPCHCAWWSLL